MPSLTLAQARDAILTQFKTAWEAQGSPPVVLWQDKEEDEPAGDTPWARVSVIPNDGGQRTMGGIGERTFERLGLVVVEVHTPVGEGLTNSDAYVNVALNAFEGVNAGGVWFRNVRPDDVGKVGAFHQVNVIAEFTFDEIR